MNRFATLMIVLLAVVAAGAQNLDIPALEELDYPALDQIELPDVETYTLPNGIKLYLLENHELPLIGGFALVRTGNLFDPPDKVGLASITGEVMRTGGTKEKTGDEIDIQLENIAASVESSIGETSGSVSFNCLEENVDEVLAVFKEILIAPEFRQDKIELSKTQYRSLISRRNDNAGSIASREFTELVYGKDTAYGWRVEYEHLNNISREDLIAFHERYFFPANVMVAVQGDFDALEMKKTIEALLADWTVEQEPVPEFPPVDTEPNQNVYLAVKKDVDQAFIRVGHLGGLLKDEDYPALQVMSDILGGGFASRLFSRIRTDLGYAYSIGSSWGANYNHPGLFRVSGSVKAEKTTETFQVILEEIERIRTEEVTDKELETAKDTVLNSFVFNFDSPSKTLRRIVRYDYHGYPKDFIFTYQKAIEEVTKDDVLRVAKEHVKPPRFTFVAVGDPADFGEPLTELGLDVKNIDLTIPRPGGQQSSETTDSSLAKGKELLTTIQDTVGGAARLAEVNDMTLASEVTLNLPQGSFDVTQETKWVAPSTLRQVQQLPQMTMTIFFDGESGWLAAPQGVQPMPPPIVQQVRGALLRVPFRLWLADRQEGWTVNAVEEDTIEVSNVEGESVRVQVHLDSGLPQKYTYQTVQMQGQPATVEETLSDWREVDGIRLPFKITSTRNGSVYSESSVTKIDLNTGLDPEALSQKP